MYRKVNYHSEKVGEIIRVAGTNFCDSESPDSSWGCTRSKGHEMPHRAGVGPVDSLAEWDDDRSTDEMDNFFAELGL